MEELMEPIIVLRLPSEIMQLLLMEMSFVEVDRSSHRLRLQIREVHLLWDTALLDVALIHRCGLLLQVTVTLHLICPAPVCTNTHLYYVFH